MKKVVLMLVVLLLIGILPVAAMSHTDEMPLSFQQCPVCGMNGIWTGTTKTDWGKMFYLYECPNGHRWWSQQI